MSQNQCPKCGGKMDMHYGLWCPKCDKPDPKPALVYDFFKVAKYIAQHEGYVWEDHSWSWVNKVLAALEIPGNDCYIEFQVLEDEEEYFDSKFLHQFSIGLMKHFGINDDTSIMINVSW